MDLTSIENLTKMDFQKYIDCFDSFPKNLYFEHPKILLLKGNRILNQHIKNIKNISENGFDKKPNNYSEKLLKLYIEMLEELIEFSLFDCYKYFYENFKNDDIDFDYDFIKPQKLEELSISELSKKKTEISKTIKNLSYSPNKYSILFYLTWYLRVIVNEIDKKIKNTDNL